MELVLLLLILGGLYCIARFAGGFVNGYLETKLAEAKWELARRRSSQRAISGVTTTWTYEDVCGWLEEVKARLDGVGLKMVGTSVSYVSVFAGGKADAEGTTVTWAIWCADPDSTELELDSMIVHAMEECGGKPEPADL